MMARLPMVREGKPTDLRGGRRRGPSITGFTDGQRGPLCRVRPMKTNRFRVCNVHRFIHLQISTTDRTHSQLSLTRFVGALTNTTSPLCLETILPQFPSKEKAIGSPGTRGAPRCDPIVLPCSEIRTLPASLITLDQRSRTPRILATHLTPSCAVEAIRTFCKACSVQMRT